MTLSELEGALIDKEASIRIWSVGHVWHARVRSCDVGVEASSSDSLEAAVVAALDKVEGDGNVTRDFDEDVGDEEAADTTLSVMEPPRGYEGFGERDQL